MQNKQTQVVLGTQNEKALLSKAQKDFNRLTKKIDTLRQEIQSFEAASNEVTTKVQMDISPLEKEYNQQRVELVHVFDRAFESGFFKQKEKKKLEHLIVTMCLEMITSLGLDELKPVYDKYSDQGGYDAEMEDTDGTVADIMKTMVKDMLGIEIDPDADVSTPEKMQEYIYQKVHQQQFEQKEQAQERERKRAERPKTPKQQAKEDKQRAEDERNQKSLREIYMDLVKAFHPDREPDEVEKARKTAIMQRVTEAYDNKDLMTLLQLQLEFERIGQTQLEGMAEDRLRYFNKLLQQQVYELDMTLMHHKERIADMLGTDSYMLHSVSLVKYHLDRMAKETKKNIKEIKNDLKAFSEKETLRAWLREYRVPKADGFSFFDMFK